ncbi:DUF4157 domain-containing protein [Cohnella massiliensis]|uniref:eCIS core domain-containing protein n=2 Tax=Cohnella TaxID=329857 RepID=UPI0015944CB9|nr:DUF4157 domain-containing protein [Cohnella massiliensis]
MKRSREHKKAPADAMPGKNAEPPRSARSSAGPARPGGQTDGRGAWPTGEWPGAAGNQAALQMIRNPNPDRSEAAPKQRLADPNRLPLEVQAKMEMAMDADFSDVTIHPNSASAAQVGALAYAQGTDIHFAPGQYDPFSRKGQQMIGHELAHVVQQKAGRVAPTGRTASGALLNESPHLEKEADALGAKAADTSIPASSAIQRMVDRTGAPPTARGSRGMLIQW